MASPDATSGGMGTARALLAAVRPHQWTKNLLVFAALVFAVKIGDPAAVRVSVGAFACYCAASSAS